MTFKIGDTVQYIGVPMATLLEGVVETISCKGVVETISCKGSFTSYYVKVGERVIQCQRTDLRLVESVKPKRRESKYDKPVREEIIDVYDVYDVLNAFGVTCPASQHAIKKLLMPGLRGGKSRLDDLKEAAHSVERAISLEEENHNV